MLEEGDYAPDFELEDQDGKKHKLSDYKGKKVVLYFYPRDNTPGCTKEACDFRDDLSAFEKNNAVILGVSKDSVKSHRKFAEKFELPFTLLSDESTEIIQSYGVWKTKKFMGRGYQGIVRSTFVIDEDGIILKVFPNVKVAGHSQEILDLL